MPTVSLHGLRSPTFRCRGDGGPAYRRKGGLAVAALLMTHMTRETQDLLPTPHALEPGGGHAQHLEPESSTRHRQAGRVGVGCEPTACDVACLLLHRLSLSTSSTLNRGAQTSCLRHAPARLRRYCLSLATECERRCWPRMDTPFHLTFPFFFFVICLTRIQQYRKRLLRATTEVGHSFFMPMPQ